MILEKMEQDNDSNHSLNLDDLKEALLNHICIENKAFFKSQQINEPEISYDERMEIALGILNQSPAKFLQRFGMNMRKEHLKYFESQSYSSSVQDEVAESLKHVNWSLKHAPEAIVRNRRYAALVKLKKDKKYFSEGEMKSRDPLLFETLVGQYQSPAEKRANRRPDAKTDTLVDVLLEGIDHDFNRELEKKQRAEEEAMMQQNDDESQQSAPSKSIDHDDDDDDSSDSNHEQWGNFDEPQASTSAPRPRKRPAAKMVTAGERDLLREEFLGIMYSNFLSGRDTEFFDYSTVDSNEEYDDTIELDRDSEDKYFDDDSEGSPTSQNISNANNDNDSEDELDLYMKHLEKNIQQLNGNDEFHEEFDD